MGKRSDSKKWFGVTCGMFGGPEHHRQKKFKGGKWCAAVSPVRFKRAVGGDWRVSCGIGSIPIAMGPANSVSDGMRIFREAEDRYWNRIKVRKRVTKKDCLKCGGGNFG